MTAQAEVDVVIVGGGPAGLQAALTLGRALADVVVFDAGPARNAAAAHMQNFVTRDGTPPPAFRAHAHEELKAYPTIVRREERVLAIEGAVDAFTVRTAERSVRARRVFLAVGVVDEMPDVPGFRELWGKSIGQCPYCHGYEVHGRRLTVYAPTAKHVEHAFLIRGWSDDVVALTGGAYVVDAELRARAQELDVTLDERPIARLDGTNGRLRAVVFRDGGERASDFMFTALAQHQVPLVQSLVPTLGLTLDEFGMVVVDEFKRTAVPGLYAIGDLTTRGQSAIIAAAAGMVAGAFMSDPEMRGAGPAMRRAAARARGGTAA